MARVIQEFQPKNELIRYYYEQDDGVIKRYGHGKLTSSAIDRMATNPMYLLDKITALEHEAAAFGFQWENTDQLMAQIQSECLEITEHLKSTHETDRAALQEEIGDLLHAVFSLCVFCHMNPEETLLGTLEKFERRLQAVKTIAKEQQLPHLHGKSFDELMTIWKAAKHRVG